MPRVYNFGAGPAALPEEVLLQAREELCDWQGTGMSVMEISHRGERFKHLAEESEQDLRDLLAIPSTHTVLFLQGGGQTQFAAIPMNLMGAYSTAAYLDVGSWSQKAMAEAKRYCTVHEVASGKSSHYTTIPDVSTWSVPTESAYFYYVDNETINGVEFFDIPENRGNVLVSDMSSNFLSKPIEISRYGLIFACAQKNIGPAGLTIVIVQRDLLQRSVMPQTPSTLCYRIQADNHSLLNTPASFSWYMASLVFKWLKKQGGVEAMAKRNQHKAKLLYQFIDNSDFYCNPISLQCRSRMNVIFTVPHTHLEAIFLKSD